MSKNGGKMRIKPFILHIVMLKKKDYVTPYGRKGMGSGEESSGKSSHIRRV